MRTTPHHLALACVAALSAAAAADFSDDPNNPSDFDIGPGLTLLSSELEDTNLADWVRFAVEDGESVTSIFNFESFLFHSDLVTVQLDQYIEIVPGTEIIVPLGQFQMDQFFPPVDDVLWLLNPGGTLGPGDYRFGLTQTTTEYSDLRFVFRTVPGPGGVCLIAGLVPLGARRRR